MKKWLRRILIAAAFIALTLGLLYEAATHVGRGWLYGEAFFDGRPTSYWRVRIDEWTERFSSPESAERNLGMYLGVPDGDSVETPRSPPRNFWTRLSESFRTAQDEQKLDQPPRVLLRCPDNGPVLQELGQDAKSRLVVQLALRVAAH